MSGIEEHRSRWGRRLLALAVGLLVVVVLLQLLEQGDISDLLADIPPEVAYLVTFLLVWFDAVIPVFPGETTLSAASTLAAEGSLELGYVMLAGALGAIVGDSSLFWIARRNTDRAQPKLDEVLKNPKVAVAWSALQRSPGLLLVAGRFVPGMRFAVNVSMGISTIRYGRFLVWSIVGGTLWSVYTCALAYNVATTLAGYPFASLVISSVITSLAIVAVFFVDRHRRAKAQGETSEQETSAGPASPGASDA